MARDTAVTSATPTIWYSSRLARWAILQGGSKDQRPNANAYLSLQMSADNNAVFGV